MNIKSKNLLENTVNLVDDKNLVMYEIIPLASTSSQETSDILRNNGGMIHRVISNLKILQEK